MTRKQRERPSYNGTAAEVDCCFTPYFRRNLTCSSQHPPVSCPSGYAHTLMAPEVEAVHTSPQGFTASARTCECNNQPPGYLKTNTGTSRVEQAGPMCIGHAAGSWMRPSQAVLPPHPHLVCCVCLPHMLQLGSTPGCQGPASDIPVWVPCRVR
jgi:hypothetical protein